MPNVPISPLTKVPGWETVPEQMLLAKYAVSVKAGTIVETGTEHGMSLSILAAYSSQGVHVISIDNDSQIQAPQNLDKAGLSENVQYLTVDAIQAGIAWKSYAATLAVPQPIQLLFIDDLHQHRHVASELAHWTKHIVRGGFLILHDVAWVTNKSPHPQHLQVFAALQEWLDTQPPFKFIEAVDSTVVFQRI